MNERDFCQVKESAMITGVEDFTGEYSPCKDKGEAKWSPELERDLSAYHDMEIVKGENR